MKNFDLDSELKRVRVPERTEDYWNEFPSQVRASLRHQRTGSGSQYSGRARLAWAGGFALAVALGVLCAQFHPLQAASQAITRQERHFRLQLAQLDAGLHLLMFNPHGMGYLLAEAN